MSELENPKYLVELREKIIELFNPDEFRLMCFDLGVEYEKLAGENEPYHIKVQALISYLRRRKDLNNLVDHLRTKRPKVNWPSLPTDEQIQKDYEFVEIKRFLKSLELEMGDSFSLNEIKELCFTLHVEFENLGTDSQKLSNVIEAFVHELCRQHRLNELISELENVRVNSTWPKPTWDDNQIEQAIRDMEPPVLAPDGTLVAGLVTTIAIVCCGYAWGYSTRDGIGIAYFFCVVVFLFVAIFGFVLANHYGSKRAKRLSIVLGLLSALPLFIVIIIFVVLFIGGRFFGPDWLVEFFTNHGGR